MPTTWADPRLTEAISGIGTVTVFIVMGFETATNAIGSLLPIDPGLFHALNYLARTILSDRGSQGHEEFEPSKRNR